MDAFSSYDGSKGTARIDKHTVPSLWVSLHRFAEGFLETPASPGSLEVLLQAHHEILIAEGATGVRDGSKGRSKGSKGLTRREFIGTSAGLALGFTFAGDTLVAVKVARAHYGDAHTVVEHLSKKGNYLSLTITVHAPESCADRRHVQRSRRERRGHHGHLGAPCPRRSFAI